MRSWISTASLLVVLSAISMDASANDQTIVAPPKPPRVGIEDFPTCVSDAQKPVARIDKYIVVQDCINRVENFNKFNLKKFPLKIQHHIDALRSIEIRYNKLDITRMISAELRKCRSVDRNGNYGTYYDEYYKYLDIYKQTMALLINLRQQLQSPQN